MESTFHHEVLKLVFPLLGSEDLVACMSVSKQWQQIARDDYLWKRVCEGICPSACKKQPPFPNHHKLYITVSRPKLYGTRRVPNLSFDDLEFYIDIWNKDRLLFSRVAEGSALRKGNLHPRSGFHDDVRNYKIRFAVEPRFDVPSSVEVSFCLIMFRKDTNQVAIFMKRSGFDCLDRVAKRASAINNLSVAAVAPSMPRLRSSISLLFRDDGDGGIMHGVFGIELDFLAAAFHKDDVLSLLEMIDWK